MNKYRLFWKKGMKASIKKGVIPILFFSFCLSGCSSVKKNIQKEIVHDTIRHIEYVNNTVYDSIYLHDSIYVYTKNDTVYQTIFKDMYKYKYIHDTINLSDTVFQTITKEKGVVKSSSASSISSVISIIFSLLIGFAIGYVFISIKKFMNNEI